MSVFNHSTDQGDLERHLADGVRELVEDGESLSVGGGELSPVLLDNSSGQHVLSAQLHVPTSLVHLLVVPPHLPILLLLVLVLEVLHQLLCWHLPRLVRHRAALVAESSRAQWSLNL